MLEFTLAGGKIVLSKEIVLFEELHTLYKLPEGPKLLESIYYMYSRDLKGNPFRDISESVKESNVFMAVFKKENLKSLKLSKGTLKLYEAATDIFLKYNATAEGRLSASIDKKLDEISIMLDSTVPTIEESLTKSGETKYNSNLGIILNMFSKIDTIMKAKSTLETAILKNESKGRLRGGGKSSFREMGIFKK